MQEVELDVLARTIWAEARGEGVARYSGDFTPPSEAFPPS